MLRNCREAPSAVGTTRKHVIAVRRSCEPKAWQAAKQSHGHASSKEIATATAWPRNDNKVTCHRERSVAIYCMELEGARGSPRRLRLLVMTWETKWPRSDRHYLCSHINYVQYSFHKALIGFVGTFISGGPAEGLSVLLLDIGVGYQNTIW
jgi:hypothetical protein